MKLSKQVRIELMGILANAERAADFLAQTDVAVAKKGNIASTTLHYTRADGLTLYEITKEIGSNLTGLRHAIDGLAHFLETH